MASYNDFEPGDLVRCPTGHALGTPTLFKAQKHVGRVLEKQGGDIKVQWLTPDGYIPLWHRPHELVVLEQAPRHPVVLTFETKQLHDEWVGWYSDGGGEQEFMNALGDDVIVEYSDGRIIHREVPDEDVTRTAAGATDGAGD